MRVPAIGGLRRRTEVQPLLCRLRPLVTLFVIEQRQCRGETTEEATRSEYSGYRAALAASGSHWQLDDSTRAVKTVRIDDISPCFHLASAVATCWTLQCRIAVCESQFGGDGEVAACATQPLGGRLYCHLSVSARSRTAPFSPLPSASLSLCASSSIPNSNCLPLLSLSSPCPPI